MSEVILTETDGHVGLATLNRPEALNALSIELMDRLIEVLEGYDRDPNIHVIVVAGSERAFAAGHVDETIMGDWEDVQIELGLKIFREKEPEDDFFADFAPEDVDVFTVDRPTAAQRSKVKAKRKTAQQSRKKNRKKKKRSVNC